MAHSGVVRDCKMNNGNSSDFTKVNYKLFFQNHLFLFANDPNILVSQSINIEYIIVIINRVSAPHRRCAVGLSHFIKCTMA